MLFLLVVMIPFVTSVEPSQQTNKILLEPYYVNSMTQNINYTYTLNVNTPDGMSEISSGIITLDAWINPTRTINVWINGQECNTQSYTVSTTYASAGRGVFSFDCTNAIQKDSINTVTFRVTGGNIGSSTAYSEITYTNNPIGNIEVHGTEYVFGDDGKMFLQFLDSNNEAVNNSECFLSLWYPNSTVLFNETLMGYLDDGIYYKNFLVPNVEGVYPASAKCYRPINFNNLILYNQTGDNFETNTWDGGYNWSVCPFGDPTCQNGWDYDILKSVLVSSASAGTGGCYGNTGYCARIDGSSGHIERGFPDSFIEGTVGYNITFKYKFLNFQTNELSEVYVFDGNWHLLEQIGLSGGRTNGVWYNASYYIDDSEFNLETILLGIFAYTMSSTSDQFFIDDVYINYIGTNITLSNETDYQILRGSGEVHVSSLYRLLNNSITNNANNTINLLPQQIWNYNTRNLTYYEDVTNYTLIQENQYNYTERFDNIDNNLTNVNNNLLSINTSITNTIYSVNQSLSDKMDVYNTLIYNFINTTYNSLLSSINSVPLNVWSYGNIQDYYNNILPTQFTDVNSIGSNEINAYDNNISSYATILTGTSATPRFVTYYNYNITQPTSIINSLNVSFDVQYTGTWVNDARNIDYSTNNGSSWNNCLTGVGLVSRQNLSCQIISFNNLTLQEMNNNLIVRIGGNSNGANDNAYFNLYETYIIINYTSGDGDRSLTSFTFDNTNYTLIQENQYNYTNRFDSIDYNINTLNNTLLSVNESIQSKMDLYNTQIYNFINTTYNDLLSSINNIPSNVWSYINRTLTYYPTQIDLTNYTLIQENQYNYTNRFDVIDNNLLLLNYSINDVPLNVWTYNTRNLTYYPSQLDLTNYTLISENVWNYNERNITSFLFDNTNYTLIRDNQYNYSDRFDDIDSQLVALNNSIITRIDTIDSDVWTYIYRNLTYYPQQIDLTNYSQIIFDVWNYNNRSLTYYEVNNITSQDVWEYVNRTLTYYEVNNITTNDIWTYNNRTLTYYPTQQDLTNYTTIVEDVWNYTGRYTHGVILN